MENIHPKRSFSVKRYVYFKFLDFSRNFSLFYFFMNFFYIYLTNIDFLNIFQDFSNQEINFILSF